MAENFFIRRTIVAIVIALGTFIIAGSPLRFCNRQFPNRCRPRKYVAKKERTYHGLRRKRLLSVRATPTRTASYRRDNMETLYS